MSFWKNYHLAQDVPDALEVLTHAPDETRLIAGGTDLLLDIQQGRHAAVHTLVDITQVEEMAAIEVRGQKLFIGAAVPLNRVVASSLVQQHASAVAEAADLIGGPQVRNTATLGGNVAHALPAGDGTIALLALAAEAEIASLDGRRRQSMESLFAGPGRSTLRTRQDILVGFYLPLRQVGEASVFRRVMRPQGVAIAILNVGIWLRRQANLIQDVRIAVGPAGPKPFRASSAERILSRGFFEVKAREAALKSLLSEAAFRTSPHRATSDYRHHLAGILFDEALEAAWSLAGESPSQPTSQSEIGRLLS